MEDQLDDINRISGTKSPSPLPLLSSVHTPALPLHDSTNVSIFKTAPQHDSTNDSISTPAPQPKPQLSPSKSRINRVRARPPKLETRSKSVGAETREEDRGALENER